jgi:hypothetical protein
MPKFLRIGNEWLNVDRIISFSVEETKTGWAVCLRFGSDNSRRYKGKKAKKLLAYLRRNKVK